MNWLHLHRRVRGALATFSLAVFALGTNYCLVGFALGDSGCLPNLACHVTPGGSSCHAVEEAKPLPPCHQGADAGAPAAPQRAPSASAPCCVALTTADAPTVAAPDAGGVIAVFVSSAPAALPPVSRRAPVLARDVGPPLPDTSAPSHSRAPPRS